MIELEKEISGNGGWENKGQSTKNLRRIHEGISHVGRELPEERGFLTPGGSKEGEGDGVYSKGKTRVHTNSSGCLGAI